MNLFDALAEKLKENPAGLAYQRCGRKDGKLHVHWPHHSDDWFYRDDEGQYVYGETGYGVKHIGSEALEAFCRDYCIDIKISDL